MYIAKTKALISCGVPSLSAPLFLHMQKAELGSR